MTVCCERTITQRLLNAPPVRLCLLLLLLSLTERDRDAESGERSPQVQRERHADGHARQDGPAALRDLQHVLVLLASVPGAVAQ